MNSYYGLIRVKLFMTVCFGLLKKLYYLFKWVDLECIKKRRYVSGFAFSFCKTLYKYKREGSAQRSPAGIQSIAGNSREYAAKKIPCASYAKDLWLII
jgi:hypothetical protein